ncbi:hypothetical protein NC652_010564 [Populus alba x Populus x berolinensis]|nr:hypothetical protein NC652_010564 [Populus alba x Populus x berolinensis]
MQASNRLIGKTIADNYLLPWALAVRYNNPSYLGIGQNGWLGVAGNVWDDGVSKLKAKVVSSSGSKSTGLDEGMRTVAARSLG